MICRLGTVELKRSEPNSRVLENAVVVDLAQEPSCVVQWGGQANMAVRRQDLTKRRKPRPSGLRRFPRRRG